VLYKEAYCSLCFALCTFFLLIFSLGMTGQRQTLQSNKLVHIRSSCLALVYHSLPHLDPDTLELLFCFVCDHLICFLASVYDRDEKGQLCANRLSLRINNSCRDSWVWWCFSLTDFECVVSCRIPRTLMDASVKEAH